MPWNTPTPTTTVENEYLLGLGGEQITVLGQNAAWQWTNVYAGSKQLATYDSAGTHFAVTDWLGTKRLELSATAASTVTVSEQCTSLPFGDSLDCTGSDVNQLHFTGKERDTESGNDYFGARYYSSNMGRFLTPDWSKNPQGVPYANYTYPQTLNLYVYVGNNPLSLADADGHCTDTTNGPCEKMQAAKKNSTAATSKNQQTSSAWKITEKMLGALKNSFYLKTEVGTGLGAEVKVGPIKAEVGLKSVRETNAKFNNQGTVKNVDEASAGIKVGSATFGPSISREQTIQNGNGLTNMNAPDTWHGNLLYDVGHGTAGSNWDIGVGVGGFVLGGGSVEVGVDAQQLYQGIEGAFSNP